ncbi:membrane protein insertase YidC [Solemya velum gill symbiont]|uniref:membrane protein insertase YidC n=2 Tax=Solemya velum gill symbiont TaxID=2340 RepID=UPI00277B5608|nr:membrane protein insertase YidC [Solemya velum gill symbiont]
MMDSMRPILFVALAFICLMLYQAWQADYGPKPVENSMPEAGSSTVTESPVPGATATSTTTAAEPSMTDIPVPAGPATQVEAGASIIRVKTDVLDIAIDTRGGSIVDTALPTYPVSLDTPEKKVHLLTRDENRYFVSQSGLMGTTPETAPGHEAVYTSEQALYELGEKDEIKVTLKWTGADGVSVNKVFTFKRSSFAINVEHQVMNAGSASWAARDYQQMIRAEYEQKQSAFMYTYMGGAYYTPEDKFSKFDYDDMRDSNLSIDSQAGWFAMLQHYFVGSWVPATDQQNHYYSKALDRNRFMLGSYGPAVTVQPGTNHTFESKFYIGPKLQKELEALNPNLELVRDYGWLAVIAKPMFWVLQKINDYVGNWGWSIIIFTILLKLVFYKLSETSYKSMAKMRKFTPRIQALKDRYGDDKQRLQAAMMEIYKKEKINPMGGCLPMLVQIPFFIALYWVLLESVELRQAPWIFWIKDLSLQDPFYVLPAVMGASMFIQQKLNPAPPDPMQAKIMQMLPIVFTIFFIFFPAGLVLYWVMNNILSISQQYVITKSIEAKG